MLGGQTNLSMASMKKERSPGNLVQMRLWKGWMKFNMFQARIQISQNQENDDVMKMNQYGI